MTSTRRGLRAITVLLALSTAALADAPPAAAPPPPGWQAVTHGPFKVELDIDGVFEAQHMTPVQVDTLALQNGPMMLEVLEGVPQGTLVKTGDVLIKFDTKAVDLAVRDAQLAASGAATRLQAAAQDLAFLKHAAEVETAAAQRNADHSVADLKRFMDDDKPLAVKRWDETLLNAHFGVDYAAEELKQLAKMYREESMTEETEEIVLTRQRRAVDAAKFALRGTENEVDRQKNVLLPRQQEDMELGVKAAVTALEVTKATLAVKLESAQQALTKATNDDADARRHVGEMLHDQAAMILKSPADGVVYYGRCEHGKWIDAPAVAAAMKPGGQFRPKFPLLTIVSPRPVALRASVGENILTQIRLDLPAVATPVALPDSTLAAKITSIDPLPTASASDVVLSVTLPDEASALLPGMSCKVHLIPADKPDAISIPAAAIHNDEPGKPYVMVRDPQGAAVKRGVKLGWRSGANVEITDGLTAGDLIQTDPAKPAPPTPAAPTPAAKG